MNCSASAAAPAWIAIAAKKRQQRDDLIPKEWRLRDEIINDPKLLNVTGIAEASGILSHKELEITQGSVRWLLAEMAKGSLTAEEVTRAFCKRAAIATQLVNCLTEIMFGDALEQAKKLDDHLNQTGSTVGPLHGIPVSLKDLHDVKGYDSAFGYASGCFKPKDRDSALVTTLRDLGAIVFVKTTTPAATIGAVTDSRLYGETVNPYNRSLSTLGSSGGEASLIALYGSPVGFGSDSGGSVRLPASACGIYGFKPSSGRLADARQQHPVPGNCAFYDIGGLMSRSLEDVVIVYNAVVQSKLSRVLDHRVLPRSLEPEVPKHRALNILIHEDVHQISLLPAVCRALEIVKAKATSAGHNLAFTGKEAEFWPDANQHLSECQTIDGFHEYRRRLALCDETIPGFLEGLLPEEPRSTTELFEAFEAKEKWQRGILEDWTRGDAFPDGEHADCLIAPVLPTATLKTGELWRKGAPDVTQFTAAWNTVDYPAIAIPITACQVSDTVDPDYKPLGPDDKDLHEQYDPKAFEGLPVGIQIVGRRWEEEKLLAIAAMIEQALAT